LKGPFQTDGQSIVLEDYLEIRPEKRPEVERLAREGKLRIGPWYDMPDEFLVSGESMIRNLRLGREQARAYGSVPSSAGFVCDIFGHNSQMPQLFAGFEIPVAFIWRGVNRVDERQILWKGSDGTVLPTLKYGKCGYSDLSFEVRHAHRAFEKYDPKELVKRWRSYLDAEAKKTLIPPILAFDGGDHQEWDQAAYAQIVKEMDRSSEKYEIVHTDLDGYMADLLKYAAKIKPVYEGELRDPGLLGGDRDEQWLIPGVLSSRVLIKQENAQCQTLLCAWAEPFAAFAHESLGTPRAEDPQGYLNVAWKWLLQNHPHDSICGCSIDTIHENMKYRFSQSRQIANRLTVEAHKKITAAVSAPLSEKELRVTVFNPLSHAVNEPAELVLKIPTDWPKFNEFFGFEAKPAFRIFGPDNQEIPYQRLAQNMNRTGYLVQDARFPAWVQSHHVTVSLPLAVPALGYTTLTVRPAAAHEPTRHPGDSVVGRGTKSGLATSERSMANGILSVTIQPNGSLSLTDMRTDQTYDDLLTFEDTADIGDGWFHGIAVNDQTFVSTACAADIALLHDGPQITTFRVRVTMNVPCEFIFDGMRRSAEFVPLVIDSKITLRAGTDRIEVETAIDNTGNDHRVRMLLPTRTTAKTYWADSPFDAVERPIALRADNHVYRELEVETKPTQTWTAVLDHKRGLAVVSEGLLESTVRDLANRPIALTLYRGFRRTVFTDGEPGGQIRGPQLFHTWITPVQPQAHNGAPFRVTRLFHLGQQLAGGLRDTQMTRAEWNTLHIKPSLPVTDSLLEVKGDAVVTSLRHVGGKLELRLFNPTLANATITVHWATHADRIDEPATVTRVNFESKPISEPEKFRPSGHKITLSRKQIATLRFE
ncbi:MAG TPA: glycoside hydrolase family 38 C-terminal domain-containing protein, partial [Planctomycetota bacterium]|nr:glycoside hydrolase family 38 C-terminal domain-containing protein [Planctomycetota bacterium]